MTPDQLDAKLPRAATWPPRIYDTTDPEERAEAVAWLMSLYDDTESAFKRLALRLLAERQQFLDSQLQTLQEAPCAPESDEQGSGGTPVPPNTEEDVRIQSAIDELRSRLESLGRVPYYRPQPNHPPAPGITYHGRDDER